MVKDVLNDTAKKMKTSVEHFRKEMGMLRHRPGQHQHLRGDQVSYYGVPTPVNQVATVKVPEPTLIVIHAYDLDARAVDKAIRGARPRPQPPQRRQAPPRPHPAPRRGAPPGDGQEDRQELEQETTGPAQHAPGGQD